jgi:hypothetical protein
MADQIGLPWVGEQPLVVAEAISRSGAGYSGRYDPTAGRIEIAYYAGSFVVLHEAAHAWFDGSLLADRWANEGFASWYALQAAAAIGEKLAGDPLTPELEKVRVPLNAWKPVGDDSAVEDYGYAASAALARLIGERAGTRALSSVWADARAGIGAYQPPGLLGAPMASGSDAAPTEAGSPPPDWRGLLDLLEDRTGKAYDDLWRAWVVRPDEADLLDERAAARRRYDEVVRRASEWHLSPLIREAMRAWQFEQAGELLDAADRTLDDRDAVAAAASGAGLDVPLALQAAFEGRGGFAAAGAEADAELAAIEAYEAARVARPAEPDLVQQVGLWDSAPDADLDRSADAFAVGDLRSSVEASAIAGATWEGAREVGRNRIISIVAVSLAVLIAVGMFVRSLRGWAIRRSTRRRASVL